MATKPGGINTNLLAYVVTLVVAMLLMQQINGDGRFSGVMGLRKGDSADGIQHVKQFLHRYGYLDYGHDLATTDHSGSFDQQLETALKVYQENFQLNVTGELDAATVHEMGKTRCGVPDIINGTNYMKQRLHSSSKLLHAVSHFAFYRGRPKWPPSRTHLTYAFVHGHLSGRNDINSDIGWIVKQSLGKWAEVSGFTFKQVAAGRPSDIKIGFYKGHHGDRMPFDGPGGTVGHATPPTGGQLHLDLEERWSAEPRGVDDVDLESALMHEMGHVLGLQHSSFTDAVMYPTIGGGEVRRDLTPDDVMGIKTLYHVYV